MDPKIILWDVDGVLIKVSGSYRRVIVESVQYYFSEFMGLGLEKKLMKIGDTQAFKLAGGFNDDWELTYAAVLCFLSPALEGASVESFPGDARSIEEKLERLKYLGGLMGSLQRPDLPGILLKAKELGGGLESVKSVLSSLYPEGFKSALLFFYPEIIKQVFEELYLGYKLYEEKYGKAARFCKEKGFIDDETALIGLDVLLELRQRYYFGIVTGRESFETEYILKKNSLHRIFPSEIIVTREDTKEGKPSPEPLLEGKKRVCEKYRLPHNSEVIYMGDSVDDLAAARNAGFYFIALVGGVGGSEEVNKLRMELHEKICDLIVDDAKELFLYL